ncbi:hypothetical protein GW756_05055 [bacterium]|nr:hypothetical protein [bacterium]NCQ55746.1 hypothetical protein [Candidatus Parcubacteria bacterium]NCS67695.1 hypothetical protein [Candidatus Peregrinibacteria bacterium]NCS96709.1 hypothetical protein [bacterium]
MDELKQQIQNLLAQDLMLEGSFKNQVLEKLNTLNQSQLNAILNSLQNLVNLEQKVVTQTVAKNPNFFHQIQHKILQIMHDDFLKKEAVVHQQAEIDLVQNLNNLAT